MASKKAVDGVSVPKGPTLDSREASKVEEFASAIPDDTPSDFVLFGRAAGTIAVTSGDFESVESLAAALGAYIDDAPDAPDEHIVRTIGKVALTMGDMRAFVETHKAPSKGE